MQQALFGALDLTNDAQGGVTGWPTSPTSGGVVFGLLAIKLLGTYRSDVPDGPGLPVNRRYPASQRSALTSWTS